MKWRKLGLIYAPKGNLWWAKGYALLPTVDTSPYNDLRIYFAALDEDRFGRIGYVDLDPDNPTRILNESLNPVLDLGELGAFDDSGVNPSCVLNLHGKKYLYYIGWQRCERVPYMLFTGLAVSSDGGQSWTRHSNVPVLDRTDSESFSRSAPCVMFDGRRFRMWYWSCDHWSQANGRTHYNTVIRHAESKDGTVWAGTPRACIAPTEPGDYAVGRPWVIKDKDLYRMWYSIRSTTQIPYRIGFAESKDGLDWTEKNREVGISPSAAGWDSEMICYPCVVDVREKRYLFYNGNRQGSTGFGCAVQETA